MVISPRFLVLFGRVGAHDMFVHICDLVALLCDAVSFLPRLCHFRHSLFIHTFLRRTSFSLSLLSRRRVCVVEIGCSRGHFSILVFYTLYLLSDSPLYFSRSLPRPLRHRYRAQAAEQQLTRGRTTNADASSALQQRVRCRPVCLCDSVTVRL